MRSATGMTETLLSPMTSASFSPLHAPFSRAWNTELTMFDWLNLSINKSRLKRFGNAMNGMSGTIPVDAVLQGKIDLAPVPNRLCTSWHSDD